MKRGVGALLLKLDEPPPCASTLATMVVIKLHSPIGYWTC